MKAIRLEKSSIGSYKVFVDDIEVKINGFVIDAEQAILEALKSQGIELTLSTNRGNYTWDSPYWKPEK